MSIQIKDLVYDSDKTISDSEDEDMMVKSLSVLTPSSTEAAKNSTQIIKRPSTKSTRGRWTIVEQKQFLKCLLEHKTNWKSYCKQIKTRSLSQIITHVKNFILFYRKKQNSFPHIFALSKVSHIIRTHGVKYGFDFSETEFAGLYHLIFENDEVLKLYQKNSKPIFNITKVLRKNKGYSLFQNKISLEIANTFCLEEEYYNIRNGNLYSPFTDVNDPRYEDNEQSTI